MGVFWELFWKNYEREKWQQVLGTSVVLEERCFFLHLVPPLFSLKKGIPAVLVVDGEKRIPLSEPHAILVTELLEVFNERTGRKQEKLLTVEELEQAVFLASSRAVRVLHKRQEQLGGQLVAIWKKVAAVARGEEEPEETLDYGAYLPYYRAPYRAVLLLDGKLANGSWKQIMDALVEAGVTWIVLSRDFERSPARPDLEDLLHFEKTVRVSVDESRDKGGMVLSPLFDLIVDEEGFVLTLTDGKRVGNLLEEPFYAIWQRQPLWEERRGF